MIKITNSTGLPAALVRAVTNDPYRKQGHISVTELIKPPRIRQLELRHDAEIEEDVTRRLWLLLGSAVHAVLERAEDRQAAELIEQRMYKTVNGWRVTGKPDLWEAPHSLHDYKFTSVWAVKLGSKPEWEAQLNAYAHLYRLHGFPVESASIIAVYRDWSKPQARRDPSYPQVGAQVVPVRLWGDDLVAMWAKSRVDAHQDAEAWPDDELPLCTAEERWERPTTWAVSKDGAKRALRVLESLEEAEAFVATELSKNPRAKLTITERPGLSVRCEDYCSVRPWCNQAPRLVERETLAVR